MDIKDKNYIYYQDVKSELSVLISKRDILKEDYLKLVAECDNKLALLEAIKKAYKIIDEEQEEQAIIEIVEEPITTVNKGSFMDNIKEFYQKYDTVTVSQMEKYLKHNGVEHGKGVTTLKKKITDYLGILVRKGELVSEKIEGITYYKKKTSDLQIRG